MSILHTMIRQKRKSLAMTQEELAKKTKVTRQAISNIELRKADPGFSLAYKIMKVLHFSSKDILLVFQ